MIYSFQLWKHPNIHYREAVLRLGRCELLCMLRSLSINTEISAESCGSAVFLSFSCRELSPRELSFLAGHSSVSLLAEKSGSLLRPLPVHSADVFPEDLPEILKYKGKTNPNFTRMMLNVALSLSSFSSREMRLTVLDPLCGRGTTLFCALCMGADAVGLDRNRRDLKEAGDYFSRYLKQAGLKHTVQALSATVNARGIPEKKFTFALSREAFHAGNTGHLLLCEADTSLAGPLLRKDRAHLLVTDLPYGVQHAPDGFSGHEPFPVFLARVLPTWRQALLPGAVLAISFNSLTLKRQEIIRVLSDAGLYCPEDPVLSGLSHPVEQAVVRDLVFAAVPAEQG